MYGRYGPDDLYAFLFKIDIILLIINLFIRNKIIDIILLLLICFMSYRFFSKKVSKRTKENQKFLKMKKKIMKPFSNIKRNFKDKDHIYKKCHKCKTILRLPLPSKRGFKSAKCPNCGKTVKIFTLKKENIEIITDKKKTRKF